MEPSQLSVDLVNVTDVNILGLGLVKSIYNKEQMEEFIRFQDSQNTWREYLAETVELAYLGISGGEWGLSLTGLAKNQIVDAMGWISLDTTLLTSGTNSVIFILIMFIVGMVRMLLDIMVRAIVIPLVQGCVFWMFGASGTLPSR